MPNASEHGRRANSRTWTRLLVKSYEENLCLEYRRLLEHVGREAELYEKGAAGRDWARIKRSQGGRRGRRSYCRVSLR